MNERERTRQPRRQGQRPRNAARCRKRRRIRRLKRLCGFAVWAAIIAGLWFGAQAFCRQVIDWRKEKAEVAYSQQKKRTGSMLTEERSERLSREAQEPQPQTPPAATAENEELKRQARAIYERQPQLLVLVNKDCPLDETYDAALRSICNKRLKASERIYSDLARMLTDGSESGHSFWIASAYRSRQRQQALIDYDVKNFKKKGMSEEEALAETLKETLPAGHSEHETGLALDILCSDNMKMDISQEQCEGNVWLREHCAEYGFILRYPKEDEAVTKISYEPWHFRYVGVEAAQFITAHGLTLEEFHALLG